MLSCIGVQIRLTFLTAIFALATATVAGAERSSTFIFEVDQSSLSPALRQNVDVETLVAAINRRLGDRGKATVLPQGQIQIDINARDQQELDAALMRATAEGLLEFRILANAAFESDVPLIKQAQALPAERKAVVMEGDIAAKWVRSKEPTPDEVDEGAVRRRIGSSFETLVLADELHITGVYLRAIDITRDQHDKPAIRMWFNREGATRFGKLTSDNLPTATGLRRKVGIIMDDRLLAAPIIKEPIGANVLLSGISSHEVDSVIAIANEGVLPYPIREVSPAEVRVDTK